MTELLIPVKRTSVTMADYVRAVVRCWSRVGEGIPAEASVAVLWAQYMIETGGVACWNYNLGNVKHVKGDGHDYQMLNGVWEGASAAVAAQLIASGQAIADTNASHIKAVGPSRESIIFQPPHPATWFRAFGSLDEGMAEHLQLLSKRFSKAWPAVLDGDFVSFASMLKSQGYFTASEAAYAAGMRGHFDRLVASTTYEELVATMHVEQEHELEDVDQSAAALWDRDAELEALVSLMHQGASALVLDGMRPEPREV